MNKIRHALLCTNLATWLSENTDTAAEGVIACLTVGISVHLTHSGQTVEETRKTVTDILDAIIAAQAAAQEAKVPG